MTLLNRVKAVIESIDSSKLYAYCGKVKEVLGSSIRSEGPDCRLGDLCQVISPDGKVIWAEVVGFRDNRVILIPIEDASGIAVNSRVVSTGRNFVVPVGKKMLGCVVDGLGRLIEGHDYPVEDYYNIYAEPPDPLKKPKIEDVLSVGIKAIDGLLTIGKGQRVGIFAGSGVGKSTLLGMMVRYSTADVNVVCLIGERGREVREFIDNILGPEGLARSVVVVATGDKPAMMKVKSAYVATAIAEFFRDLGKDVLLVMDSVTRFAMAQREIGLDAGEPPTLRGYPPSVFKLLPKLLERAGTSNKGTITAFYTVLVEGEDFDEPISDTVRGILDGHIVLKRDLASRGIYPAIDVLESVSRLMPAIVSKEHLELAHKFKRLLATYMQSEDLINVGAYRKGANLELDLAVSKITDMWNFIRQRLDEAYSFDEVVEMLGTVVS